ncbi:MAG: hypothetical protein AB7T49_03635 [Oligoflexales bacterium]
MFENKKNNVLSMSRILLVMCFGLSAPMFGADLTCIQTTSSLTTYEAYPNKWIPNSNRWEVEGTSSAKNPITVRFRNVGSKNAELVGNAGTASLILIFEEGVRFDYLEKSGSGAPILWSFFLGSPANASKYGGPDHPVVVTFKNNAAAGPVAFTFGYSCQ